MPTLKLVVALILGFGIGIGATTALLIHALNPERSKVKYE